MRATLQQILESLTTLTQVQVNLCIPEDISSTCSQTKQTAYNGIAYESFENLHYLLGNEVDKIIPVGPSNLVIQVLI